MKTNQAACGIALALLAALAPAGLSGCADEPADGPAAPAAPSWKEDPRLIDLFTLCTTHGHFSGDTSDILPVLVEKLTHGQLEVVRNVREELAAMGDAAVPELDALVRRHYSERFGTPPLRNALGVLRLSDATNAHDLLRRCLEHPNEDIRQDAAAALSKHAEPEDYEVLRSLLDVSTHSTRGALLSAMHTADPERLAADLARWLEEDLYADLHAYAARAAAKSAGARASDLFGELAYEVSAIQVRPFLLAALVNAGDERALEELRGMLAGDGDRPERTYALEAVELTGRMEEVLPALEAADPVLRVRAVSLLKPVADEPWAHAALSAALQDGSGDVRQVALDALLSVGDPAAADLAVTLAGGALPELKLAMMTLRPNWDANPGLSARVLDVLLRRLEEEAARPLNERKALLQALGVVPEPAAAERLLELARRHSDEVLNRMSAHRWLAREAGNTEPGRAVLREAWRAEPDARRRLDLLEGGSFGLDDATRAFLLEVVLSEHAGPWERLYAAERVARQGPAAEVAPILKRVALRVDHPDVRPAFDCLLWRWYGRESAGG